MAGEQAVPEFEDAQVLGALRAAARHGLTQTRQGEGDVLRWGWDMEAVNDLLVECEDSELHEHGLSDHYPEYNDYIVILKVELEDEPHPFYVKVALALPNLTPGELMSFHPWGMQR